VTAIEKVGKTEDATSVGGLEEIFQSDNKSVTQIDNTMTPEEAALALGKSVRTVRRMLEKGLLAGFKVSVKNATSGEYLGIR
jgi:hypothetical protein